MIGFNWIQQSNNQTLVKKIGAIKCNQTYWTLIELDLVRWSKLELYIGLKMGVIWENCTCFAERFLFLGCLMKYSGYCNVFLCARIYTRLRYCHITTLHITTFPFVKKLSGKKQNKMLYCWISFVSVHYNAWLVTQICFKDSIGW